MTPKEHILWSTLSTPTLYQLPFKLLEAPIPKFSRTTMSVAKLLEIPSWTRKTRTDRIVYQFHKYPLPTKSMQINGKYRSPNPNVSACFSYRLGGHVLLISMWTQPMLPFSQHSARLQCRHFGHWTFFFGGFSVFSPCSKVWQKDCSSNFTQTSHIKKVGINWNNRNHVFFLFVCFWVFSKKENAPS